MKNNIKYYREQSNLTQAQLAKLVGTTRETLRMYENGDTTALRLYPKIAKALNVSPSALILGVDQLPAKVAKIQEPFDGNKEQAFSNLLAKPYIWSALFKIEGIDEKCLFEISQDEAELIEKQLISRGEANSFERFICLDTEDNFVAINAKNIVRAELFWDSGFTVKSAQSAQDIEYPEPAQLVIHTAQCREPYADIQPETIEEFAIVYEMMVDPWLRQSDFFHYRDSEGTDLFFRWDKILMAVIPQNWISEGMKILNQDAKK